MSVVIRLLKLQAKVDPTTLGEITRNLPNKFFHFTHDEIMKNSIIKHGFDLKHFGYSGRKFNAQSITQFDPAGVYCLDLAEVENRGYKPWLIFNLRNQPQALISKYHFLPDLAKAYNSTGEKLRQKLLQQNIQAICNVREWIILAPHLINISDWSGK
jgi:hypothetical protein